MQKVFVLTEQSEPLESLAQQHVVELLFGLDAAVVLNHKVKQENVAKQIL